MVKEWWCVGCNGPKQLHHFDRNPRNPSDVQLLYFKCEVEKLPPKFHTAYKICGKQYALSKRAAVKVCACVLWNTVEIE